MMQDTGSSSSACPMIAPAVSDPTAQQLAQPRAGLSWRHFATVVLMLVACPILLAAAALVAPLLLLFLGIEAVRKVFELNPSLRSAPSH
jgi:hypothetical protein